MAYNGINNIRIEVSVVGEYINNTFREMVRSSCYELISID